jgi:glycolate oxidase iron-sulfur subunit
MKPISLACGSLRYGITCHFLWYLPKWQDAEQFGYPLGVQTQISAEYSADPRVTEIEAILRKCVHCGMCLATCPTYQLLGDELDSPRGRIYQIKQVVEGHAPTVDTLRHLDRCLTCRNCETTCPSGVQYGHLIDNGRALVEERVSRGLFFRIKRGLLLTLLPHRSRIQPLVRLGQAVRGVMPQVIARSIPAAVDPGPWPEPQHGNRMLVLDGCVQPALTPMTNAAAARVLDACGVSLVSVQRAGCCGAVKFHLNQQDDALDQMRQNIDAWWPEIEKGAMGVLATASGCGVMLKDYGHALASDPVYADKAKRLSEMTMDTVEAVRSALDNLDENRLATVRSSAAAAGPIAFHPPCTLQHGQRLAGVTEGLLRRLGYTLTKVENSNLCCGSAGTYSIFQPEISGRLQSNKVAALESGNPSIIATANIGCQLHIGQGVAQSSDVPVVHWIELIDRALAGEAAGGEAGR